ncbi:hypothetical protein D3C85_1352250 [compost metagenome]
MMILTLAGISPARCKAAIADGTVLIRRTCSRAGNCGSSRALRAMTRKPPLARVTKISQTDRSKHTEVEASTPWMSSLRYTCCDQCARAATLRWAMATPLGWPVEPEV